MKRKNKKYFGEANHKLREKNLEIINKYLFLVLEKSGDIIVKNKSKKILFENDDIEIIKDISYSFLEEIYKETLSGLKIIYKNVPDFNIDNILQLTFQKDGRTYDERISQHLKEANEFYNLNSQNKDQSTVIIDTLNKIKNDFERLYKTESCYLETALKKNEKPFSASMLIIEAGCGDLCQGGEYAADENVDLPPYHPNCQCIWYFDETDDSDDIEDLELEVEE